MELSRQSPKPTRFTGIGLVIALHLAGIYALSAGLIKAPTRPPEIAPIKPLPAEPRTPPPPAEPYRADRPIFKDPITSAVPPRDDWVLEKTPVTAEPQPETLRPPTGPATFKTEVPSAPPVAKTPLVTQAGAVCSVMPTPELPAVNWSGEAVLQVLATVRGGRVVGTDVRVTQGALDAKTRRSLTRSVESALAGYQCQGDAQFQQDFAFRLD